jgi:glycosyltransferase involved in cell wall biosynthesis
VLDLAIVIPARNARASLREQLDALLAQQWSGTWEVLVVDNDSDDGTSELVAEYARRDPRVRLGVAKGVHGAAAVRNAGIALTDATAVAMCDADDIVGPNWVPAMGDALAAHAAVTGPLEVVECNPEWLVRTRGAPPRTEPATFHGLFALLPAGNFGMQRGAWDAIGGFDPTVISNEDVDLSLRVWEHGLAVHFAPDALVHYRYRSAARELFRQGFIYGMFRPLVARRARARGLRVPRTAGWRSWIVLFAWLPRLVTREGRASWMWVAGVRTGLVCGCLRFRVLYL